MDIVSLCLGNFSKDYSAGHNVDVPDISDVDKCLMIKKNIK